MQGGGEGSGGGGDPRAGGAALSRPLPGRRSRASREAAGALPGQGDGSAPGPGLGSGCGGASAALRGGLRSVF